MAVFSTTSDEYTSVGEVPKFVARTYTPTARFLLWEADAHYRALPVHD